MALSTNARKRLEVAIAHRATAKEIADAVDSGGNAAAAAVADIATADATDAASAVTLANATKAKVNALLAALRAAGLLAS
jgi:hypothetical protein